MQKINYVAYDENNKVVAIGEDIDSIMEQAETYNRFKNNYGVQVYPILDNKIIRELARNGGCKSS